MRNLRALSDMIGRFGGQQIRNMAVSVLRTTLQDISVRYIRLHTTPLSGCSP